MALQHLQLTVMIFRSVALGWYGDAPLVVKDLRRDQSLAFNINAQPFHPDRSAMHVAEARWV